MNVFSSGHRNQPWVWQVTGLCFILGVLLAGSLQTVRNISRSGLATRVGQATGTAIPRSDKIKEQEKVIQEERERITRLENSMVTDSKQRKILNDELQRLKIFSGLTEVRGPGLIVTLQDSKRRSTSARASFEVVNGLIHDVDLQAILNELGQSGVEAISINNQRVIGKTALRCVGPTIHINNVPLVPPYVIQAVGEPDTLYGGVNLPSGVLEGIRRFDPDMVKLEKKQDLSLPAYTGSTEIKFARPTAQADKSAKGETGDSSEGKQ